VKSDDYVNRKWDECKVYVERLGGTPVTHLILSLSPFTPSVCVPPAPSLLLSLSLFLSDCLSGSCLCSSPLTLSLPVALDHYGLSPSEIGNALSPLTLLFCLPSLLPPLPGRIADHDTNQQRHSGHGGGRDSRAEADADQPGRVGGAKGAAEGRIHGTSR